MWIFKNKTIAILCNFRVSMLEEYIYLHIFSGKRSVFPYYTLDDLT